MFGSVFNTDKVAQQDQPMFFGETLNIARYDIQRLPVFEKLTDTQHSFFWRPVEVNLTKDIIDFKDLSEAEKHIFIKNIAYQTMLDSVQGRAPFLAFLPWISLPELEVCVTAWGFFESIHSRSYSYILQNLYSDPTPVFESIIEDTNILDRAKSVIHYYNDFVEYSDWFRVLGEGTHTINSLSVNESTTITLSKREMMKKLYLALVSVYVLEAVRFYVSFACSFAFGQLGKMTGNAKIIKFIARDEAQHLAITTNIIRLLQKGKDGEEWAQVISESEEIATQLFVEAVEQEKEWARYLFQHGSIIGLNETLLCMYVEHIAGKRMRNIGLKSLYQIPTNPLGWMSDWLDSGDEQVAPQETEITSYLVGAVDSKINEDALDNIEL